MKRIAIGILIVILLISFTGCIDNLSIDNDFDIDKLQISSGDAVIRPSQFGLRYDPRDSLNPYQARTMLNIELSRLLFDSLVALDTKFKPLPSLAKSININDKTCVITLRENIKFSDNSPITADDVVFSILAAKTAKSSFFKDRMSNVSSVKKENGNVIIQLNEADRFFDALLDIPIIKQGEYKNDQIPAGSGRYVLKTENSAKFLTVNELTTQKKPKLEKILLYDIPDNDALLHSLEIGNISYMYDNLDEGVIPRANGSNINVTLNNFIYMGVNHSKDLLKDPLLLKAISKAIKRDELVKTAFSGLGLQTELPFHPDWYFLDNIEQITEEPITAAKAFEQAGYTGLNKDGIRTKGNVIAEVELLYNKDNSFKKTAAEMIAKDFASVGIKTILVPLDFKEYTARIRSNRFDLYIGETKLGNNMDLTPLLKPGSSLAFGIGAEKQAYAEYEKFKHSNQANINEFIKAFNNELPIIPICFRHGAVFHSRHLKGDFKVTADNIYANIEDWYFE